MHIMVLEGEGGYCSNIVLIISMCSVVGSEGFCSEAMPAQLFLAFGSKIVAGLKNLKEWGSRGKPTGRAPMKVVYSIWS